MSNKKKIMVQDVITEEFEVDPYQGFAAIAVSFRRPGYKLLRMDRRHTRATITWVKEK